MSSPNPSDGASERAPASERPTHAACVAGERRDWRLAVDIGGTFTDVVLLDAVSGAVVVEKMLTTPADPLDGVRHGRHRSCCAAPACARPTSPRRSCTPRR